MASACGWANPAPIKSAINAGAVMHRPLWLLKIRSNSSISGNKDRQNQNSSNCSTVHGRECRGRSGSSYVLSTLPTHVMTTPRLERAGDLLRIGQKCHFSGKSVTIGLVRMPGAPEDWFDTAPAPGKPRSGWLRRIAEHDYIAPAYRVGRIAQ